VQRSNSVAMGQPSILLIHPVHHKTQMTEIAMSSPKSNVVRIKSQHTNATNNRFKFTQRRLEQIQRPSKGVQYYYDTDVSGLCLRITATGAKSYALYRRVKGKPVRITLGRINAMTLACARDAARQLNGQLAAGVDVVQQRKDTRKKHITVGELFTIWQQSAKTRKLRCWRDDEKLWERHLRSKLKQKEAIRVTTADIQKIVDGIAIKHPRTANKAAALVSRVFNSAARKGNFTGQK